MSEANISQPAQRHLEGQTVYVDDQLPRQGTLETLLVTSPYARAAVAQRDVSAALAVPGVRRVILAEDVPGANSLAPVHGDEVLIAGSDIEFFGQIVAVVVGESLEACRAGASALDIGYQPLPPVIGIEEAIAVQSFHSAPRTIERGDFVAAIEGVAHRLQSSFHCGGQEHFYLETQVALAEPDGRGGLRVACSSEDLSGLQAQVARVLGCQMNRIEVECPRIGGGFAGKQAQSHACASIAALVAELTGRPARVRFTREQDMMLTGKRHPVYAEFEVGYDDEGRLLAAEVFVFLDGGCSLENSETVLENLLLHLDNAYYIPNFRVSGRICKTHSVSNTLCVGAGAPQAVAVTEEMLGRVARRLGVLPEILRQRNMYQLPSEGGDGETARSHFGQELPVKRLQAVWRNAIRSADFPARRKGIRLWNAKHPFVRRGLAVIPVKFGIGSLDSTRGQATSLIQAFTDGSLRVSYGGVDTGQGIAAAVLDAVADELGVAPEKIRASGGDTARSPNSPLGSGIEADLAAGAARQACERLKARLIVLAAQMLQARGALVTVMDDVSFSDGEAFSMENPEIRVAFAELVAAAYSSRVSLMASGFARSQSVKYDAVQGKGTPFREFTFGAAVSEVQEDSLTGETKILRSDLLVDAGPVVDTQSTGSAIRGAFVQGAGWLTSEELLWGGDGELLTRSPDTYKVPTIADAPLDFRVTVVQEKDGDRAGAGVRPKDPTACSFMLALSVREAIKDAVLTFGESEKAFALHMPSPSTPEAVCLLIERLRGAG